MKRINLICTLIASTLLLTNCQKKEVSDETLLNNNSKNQAAAGDGEFDVLGYGYDVTKEYLNSKSVSYTPVLDMKRLKADHLDKINIPTAGSGDGRYFYGATAKDFVSDINVQRTFNVSATIGDEKPQLDGQQYFTPSFGTENTDHNIKDTKSRFSYGRYEHIKVVKSIQFAKFVTTDLLINYLNNDFKNNINQLSADQLVDIYGTHVLLDITVGGRMLFNFTANISSEKTTETKKSKVEGGLGFFVKKFGINFKSSKTTEEITTNFNESRERQMNIKYQGGSNSGTSVTFNSDGYSSESINIGSWEQSVTDRNCALIDITRMVPIYHFISNPTKKALVKTAIDKHIKENQITELGEVPVYSLYYDGYKYNKKSSLDNHVLSLNPSIEDQKMTNEGVIFYAFNKQKAGTIPIYRFRNDKINDNFFTKDLANYSDYRNEGIVFYAFPSSTTSMTSNLTPIYRHWSNFHMDHYYTPVSGTFTNYTFEKIEFYGIKAN
ncbi:MAC/perforin domain-containing protein [Sphingobacterium sp. ML3W]|uniref:MAC/perforin domain-containing protein n=1 Tax=Sphingobacterium sp. ML3W TaxID=1538644 RepID=UPI000A91CC72|nr:MAC/perforin domain-containing protein [Sphingobacterium sp. ML3W]